MGVGKEFKSKRANFLFQAWYIPVGYGGLRRQQEVG